MMHRMLSYLFVFASIVLFDTIWRCDAFIVPHVFHRVRTPTDLKISIRLAVNENDSTDVLLKKLKRSCNQCGHLRALRYKENWETAADKKKRKTAQARMKRRFERANERYQKLARGEHEYNT